MAKKTPAWQLMGLEAPPPVVGGYHDYGTVYRSSDGPCRRDRREEIRLMLWSWHYWGRKIRRDIEAERAAGNHGSLGQRTMDRIGLLLVAATDGLYQRLRPHLEG